MILALTVALAISLSGAEEARLTNGEIILNVMRDDGRAAGQVDAWIDIPAPPALVWSTMNDCAGAARFVPNLISCRIIETDPHGAWEVREHLVDPGWLLSNVRSQFRVEYLLEREIRFSQIDGDFDVMQGRWTLAPLDDGQATRLRYEARLKPKMWVPAFVIRHVIEDDAPASLRALRSEVLRRKGQN